MVSRFRRCGGERGSQKPVPGVDFPTCSIVQIIPRLSNVAFQKLSLDLSQVVPLEDLNNSGSRMNTSMFRMFVSASTRSSHQQLADRFMDWLIDRRTSYALELDPLKSQKSNTSRSIRNSLRCHRRFQPSKGCVTTEVSRDTPACHCGLKGRKTESVDVNNFWRRKCSENPS